MEIYMQYDENEVLINIEKSIHFTKYKNNGNEIVITIIIVVRFRSSRRFFFLKSVLLLSFDETEEFVAGFKVGEGSCEIGCSG